MALLVAVLVLAAGGRAAAQTAPVTVPAPGGDVTVIADQLERLDGLMIATGNVEITRGTARLTADRVELNRETGDAVAIGRAIFYDGENRLTGERIDYNWRTGTGVVHDGEARSAPYYRIAGERMERLGESVYRVRRGIFTTCEDDPPLWSFRAGSATADLNSLVYGTNASFWVKNLPLIPWFPFFAAAIRRERQTGFLFPRVGSTTRKGYFIEQPFYWAISDSQDATITLDAYEKVGIGLNAEYRYLLSQDHRGDLAGFFIRETERDGDDRGWWALRHDWLVTPGLSVKADVNGVSDDEVFREYTDRLHTRSLQRAESNVFFTKTWERWNLVANALWYQDLTTRRPVELQRLPEIRLEGVRQPVPGLPGVLYEVTASAVNFVREAGSDGIRVDMRPRLSRPFAPGGYLTVTPFVGGRLTAYDTTVTGMRLSGDGVTLLEETEDEARIRRLVELGTDVEARATRVWDVGGLWNVSAAQHSIEPRLNYTYIAGEDLDHLPLWTEDVDRIPRTSVIGYSLVNRVRARSVALPGTEPLRWEFLRLTLAHSYNLRDEQRPWGDVTGDIILNPGRFFSLRADAAYNPYGDGVTRATTDVAVAVPRVTASVGTRFERRVADFLQGNLQAEVTPNLLARLTTNWDLKTDTFVESRFAIDLRFQCWAFTVEYVSRNQDEDAVYFTVNLLGVGAPLTTSAGLGGAGTSRGTVGGTGSPR